MKKTPKPTADEILNAPDALHLVLAVEECPRYQRPTRVAVMSSSIISGGLSNLREAIHVV